MGAAAAELWRDATAAFAALTSLPIPAADMSRARLARSVVFFPVVGVALGAILVVCERATVGFLPPAARSGILIGLLLGLTGGDFVGDLVYERRMQSAPSVVESECGAISADFERYQCRENRIARTLTAGHGLLGLFVGLHLDRRRRRCKDAGV